MSQQTAWDSLINQKADRVQYFIDIVAAQKAQLETSIANVAGGTNEDVVVLRQELSEHLPRVTAQLDTLVAEKATILSRLYASLTAGQQAAVETIMTDYDNECQTMLTDNCGLCPETLLTRLNTACSSVNVPANVNASSRCRLFMIALNALKSV